MELLLSIVALSVSFFALYISYWRGKTTIQHNKITHRPHVVVDSFVYGPEKRLYVGLENKGPGVAFVNSLHCRFNGIDIFNKNLKEWNLKITEKIRIEIREQIPEENKRNEFRQAGSVELFTYLPWNGDAMSAGEKMDILKIEFNGEFTPFEHEMKEVCRSVLDLLTLSFTYESIYKEKFSSSLRRRIDNNA